MIKVAIHQPNFFPWMGYFHKIANCNTFVYLDDVQFSGGSVTGRAKIMVKQMEDPIEKLMKIIRN